MELEKGEAAVSAAAMTSRERLLAALRGDPIDRVPWSPYVDGNVLSSLSSDHELDEAGLHRAIGADAMLRYVRERLDEIEDVAGSFHKFILGSGDALPKNTPAPVLRAVSKAVRERR